MRFKGMAAAILMVCMMTSLTGCGSQPVVEEVKNPYSNVVSMESTPIVDYSVPRQMPNIMVDIGGYEQYDAKMAVVKGTALPDAYRLFSADTDEPVYEGYVEDIQFHQDLGIYSGILNFTDYDVAGVYYLECDIVGQSLRFEIKENLYQELFQDTYEVLMERCQKETLTLSEAVTLLQCYEWYGNVFPDENRDNIPDVLKELSNWINFMDEQDSEVENRALYAAFLAKFSYLYKGYDYKFATDCLKRGSSVYGQLQNAISKDAESFFALTELYRATGLATYRQQIESSAGFFDNNSSYLEDQTYLCAIMTYLVTRHKVNKDLCETFMSNMMGRAEEISQRYQEMIYPVTARNNGPEDVLKRAVEVSSANYVMNNYQYTQIAEDILHYLMGRNSDSVNLYAESENKADYLYLFSQLVYNHPEH